MVTWNYGYEEESEINFREEQNNLGGNFETLNFDYKIIGDKNKLTAVFDDGEKTVLKFNSLPQRLPSVFIKIRGKKGVSMANYKIQNNCYVVDRVADEIEVRFSEKEILKIKNKTR